MAEPRGEFSQPQDDELIKALARMVGGALPIVGEAIDASDMADAIKSGDTQEQALIAAGAALPFVTPQMLRAAKGIPEAFAQLPDSAFKRLTYNLLQRGETTVTDIKEMFSDAGDLIGWHGTKDTIQDFTTANTDALAGSNTKDLWGGPGLYQGHGSIQSPIEIGDLKSGNSPVAVHQVITPREDISKLAGNNFAAGPQDYKGLIEFSDQSTQVKDSLSTLYPNTPDAMRQQLYDVSPMATSEPFAVAGQHTNAMGKSQLASDSVQHIPSASMAPDQQWQGNMPAIRQQANAAGLAGNIHVEGVDNPRLASVNFNPDTTHVEGVDIATLGEWDAARGGMGNPAAVGSTLDNMTLTPDAGNPRIRRSPNAQADKVAWDNYEDIFLEPSFMREDAIDAIASTGVDADIAGAAKLQDTTWDTVVEGMPTDLAETMGQYSAPNFKMSIKAQGREQLESINTALQGLQPYAGEGLEEMIELIDAAQEIDPKAASKLMELYDVMPSGMVDW